MSVQDEIIGSRKATESVKIADKADSLKEHLRQAINRLSMESGSDTPDFILAEFLVECLTSYDKAVVAREKWHGRACGGLKGPIPIESIPNPPTQWPIELETFGNQQAERLESFQRGYKAGYADASEDSGKSTEASEACDNILRSAIESGMSLSVAYGMAYMAAKHLDGSLQ